MASSTDRTATMTSDTLPTPNVVSASSEGIGVEAFHAFDKDSVSGAWQPSSGTTGTLQYYWGGPKWASDGYTITAQTGNRCCANWTYEGSNDGSGWTVLNTQSGQTFSNAEKKTYTATNTIRFGYYRLNITANGGGAVLEIAEMQIFAPNAGVLIGEI